MNNERGSGIINGLLGGLLVCSAVLAPIYLLWRFGLRWFMVGMGLLFTFLAFDADEILATAHSWAECQAISCMGLASVGETLISYSENGGWWTHAIASWILVAGMSFIVDVAPNLRRFINGPTTEQ